MIWSSWDSIWKFTIGNQVETRKKFFLSLIGRVIIFWWGMPIINNIVGSAKLTRKVRGNSSLGWWFVYKDHKREQVKRILLKPKQYQYRWLNQPYLEHVVVRLAQSGRSKHHSFLFQQGLANHKNRKGSSLGNFLQQITRKSRKSNKYSHIFPANSVSLWLPVSLEYILPYENLIYYK